MKEACGICPAKALQPKSSSVPPRVTPAKIARRRDIAERHRSQDMCAPSRFLSSSRRVLRTPGRGVTPAVAYKLTRSKHGEALPVVHTSLSTSTRLSGTEQQRRGTQQENLASESLKDYPLRLLSTLLRPRLPAGLFQCRCPARGF